MISLGDGGGKLFQPKPVVAFEQTGWPLRFSRLPGVILLVCTVLYVWLREPQLAVLFPIVRQEFDALTACNTSRIPNCGKRS